MAVFLLVHGAWHGGWCWTPTREALRAHGHEVHCPTLTGLGERSHLLAPGITVDTHVTDIINTVRWRALENVILVGHSYGGIIITGVAAQIPERLRALVYLDAFVPEESNVPLFARASPTRMAAFQKQIDAGAIGIAPDGAVDTWAEDPETKQWLMDMCTPQPVDTFRTGVRLTGREAEVPARHYILAARNTGSSFPAEYDRVRRRKGWTTDTIDTLHDAMIEAPQTLARKLDAFAQGLTPEEAR